MHDAELRHHDDGLTVASTVSTPGGTTVTARVMKRAGTTSDEQQAADAMARAWSKRGECDYRGELEPDKTKYPDAYLKLDGRVVEQLQVTQMDPAYTGLLRQRKQLNKVQMNSTRDAIQRVVTWKAAKVEPAERGKTLLVLFLPMPVPRHIRQQLISEVYDGCGFRGVWVAASSDEAFELKNVVTR